ncbi:hypothetical protein BH10PSE9_BH10PSE9_09700 [soil metagenome]
MNVMFRSLSPSAPRPPRESEDAFYARYAGPRLSLKGLFRRGRKESGERQ